MAAISLSGDSQKIFVKCLKSLLSNRPIGTVLELYLQEVCRLTDSKHGLMGQRVTAGGDVFFRYYGVYGMPPGFQYHKLYADQGYIDDKAHNMLVDFAEGKPTFRVSHRSQREKPYPVGHPDVDNAAFIPLHDINRKVIGVLALSGDHLYNQELINTYDHLIELSSVFLQIILERTALIISRDNFLANISHEIRTPLSGIMCVNSILMNMDLPSNLRHHINIIETCCTQLLDITNDILDYTYIRSGNMQLKSEEISLHDIIKTVEVLVRDKVQPGVELSFVIHPDVPTTLMGDRTRIIQILLNIIDNSSKFTKKGSIHVTIGYKKTRSDGGTNGGTNEGTNGGTNNGSGAGSTAATPIFDHVLLFSIADTGCGIDPERMEHIFDMVNNFNPSYLSSQCGVGLGLPIAKHMVEMYSGTIRMESQLGVGTKVDFTLCLEGVDRLEEIKKELGGADVLLHVSDGKTRDDIFDFLLNVGARPQIANDHLSVERYLSKNGINFNFKNIVTDTGIHLPTKVPIVNVVPGSQSKVNFAKLMQQQKQELEQSQQKHLTKPNNAFHRATYRILVAEDDIQNMEVFVMLLVTMGYTRENITRVTNGAELYVALIDESKTFDIAFIDLKMPVMNGITAIKQYHAHIASNPNSITAKRRKHMLILAVTASISAQTRQACFDAKMNGYIQKPIKLEDLENVDVMFKALDPR